MPKVNLDALPVEVSLKIQEIGLAIHRSFKVNGWVNAYAGDTDIARIPHPHVTHVNAKARKDGVLGKTLIECRRAKSASM